MILKNINEEEREEYIRSIQWVNQKNNSTIRVFKLGDKYKYMFQENRAMQMKFYVLNLLKNIYLRSW